MKQFEAIAERDLRAQLRDRAQSKRLAALADSRRRRALEKKNKKPAQKRERLSTPELLAEMRDALETMTALTAEQLKEIREVLRRSDLGEPGAVEFVVTERDENGKMKSFRVVK